ETDQKPASKSTPSPSQTVSRSSSPSKKLSYKDQRDYDLLPDRIEAIDQRMGEIEQHLSDPNLYTRNFAQFDALTKENGELIEEKEAAEMRWLELAEEVERLASTD
ncbi:MAG: ABC transporter ATP-binding protein, partial [Sphingomonadales bacterium]|nr:ABC transporter ATP-binding protein [Sphingomonadales bacterium]